VKANCHIAKPEKGFVTQRLVDITKSVSVHQEKEQKAQSWEHGVLQLKNEELPQKFIGKGSKLESLLGYKCSNFIFMERVLSRRAREKISFLFVSKQRRNGQV
jgi:hypothetical protein